MVIQPMDGHGSIDGQASVGEQILTCRLCCAMSDHIQVMCGRSSTARGAAGGGTIARPDLYFTALDYSRNLLTFREGSQTNAVIAGQ
jgi:hypothetical protein